MWDAATGEVLHVLTGHTGRVTGGVFSSDGTRILTTDHGSARVWDAATGGTLGWSLELLPGGELVVWSEPDHGPLAVSSGAWRWLGWLVSRDGRVDRLPVETFGELPAL